MYLLTNKFPVQRVTERLSLYIEKHKMKEVIKRPFFLRVCCDQTPPTAFEPHQSSDPLLYISNAHKLLQ